MKTVWKFQMPLREGVERTFGIPGKLKPLMVKEGTDGEGQALVNLWCEVDTDSEQHSRTFEIIGTGQEIPADSAYCGTAFFGPIVFHIYEHGVDLGDPIF